MLQCGFIPCKCQHLLMQGYTSLQAPDAVLSSLPSGPTAHAGTATAVASQLLLFQRQGRRSPPLLLHAS